MNISIEGKSVRIVANAGDTDNEIGVVIDLPEEKADEVWRAIRNACWMIRNPAKTQHVAIDRAAFDAAA